MKPHDPMTMLALMVGAATFAGEDIVAAHRIVRDCAGDTDTTGSFLGFWTGAYTGLNALEEFTCNGGSFKLQLDLVAGFIDKMFGLNYSNITASSMVYSHIAELLNQSFT